MQEEKTKPDPYKVFKALADIITDRGEVKVTLISVTKKDEKQTT